MFRDKISEDSFIEEIVDLNQGKRNGFQDNYLNYNENRVETNDSKEVESTLFSTRLMSMEASGNKSSYRLHT